MPLPVRGIALSVLAVATLIASPSATAQFIPSAGNAVRAPQLGQIARGASAPSTDVVLAGPVDPDTYIVGPGDVFMVSVGGGSLSSQPRQLETSVTADGLLIVAEAGTFRAAGRTLSAVRAEARAALRGRYRNIPTDVALAIPRRFSVYVSGAVPLPGRQVVTAIGRVEDAIAETTGELNPLELADYETPARFEVERRVALRNVRVTDLEGAARSVDLYRYYATGDLAFNPKLEDGDAVFVPTFDPIREGVSVSGDVERPGTYDWRADDTAAALAAVSGAPSMGTVRRTRADGTRTESVEVALEDAASLDIRPRDQVTILSSTPDAGYATVVGEVAYPGTYPIVSGQTALDVLVEAAGGLTPEALIRGAYLERTARSEPQAALDPLATPTSRPVTAAAFDSTVTTLGQLSDLGLIGRRYYVQQYAATPRLSVDIASALEGGDTVPLRDGDRLVVPRDLGAVRVFGQVSSPGYVPFENGLTAEAYVDRAGGSGPVATTVYTVDARTGQFVPGAETTVRAGDAVFVDRNATSDSPVIENLALQERNFALQEIRAEQEANRDRRQFLIQTVATSISAISTLIFAYTQLR